MTSRTRLTALSVAAVLGLASACGVSETEEATDYPTRPIDVVVPYPAGGGSDVLARALVDSVNASGDIDEKLQVVNREGGGGVVGVSEVLGADPNGYTIVIAPEGPITLQPQVADVSYDPLALTPIAQITLGPVVVAVPAESPYETIEDLVEAARQSPGEISLGEGPLSYAIPAAQLEQLEDVDFNNVDFEGDAASATALLGGNVDAVFTQSSGILPQVSAGEVRVLAVGSEERSEFFPDSPTFAEAGIDITAVAAYGVFGPDGVPDEIADMLSEAFLDAIDTEEFRTVVKTAGLPIEPADGGTLMDYYTERTDEVATIIKEAGGSL